MAGPSRDQLATIFRGVMFVFVLVGAGTIASGQQLCLNKHLLLFLHSSSHLALTRQPGNSLVAAPYQTPRQLGTSVVPAPQLEPLSQMLLKYFSQGIRKVQRVHLCL